MARKKSTAKTTTKSATKPTKKPRGGAKRKRATKKADAFQPREAQEAARVAEPEVHVIRPGVICDTDTRGHKTPRGRGRLEIVVDASEGFIPLWEKDTTLRWRFQEHSMLYFRNPTAAKAAIENLLGEAISAWGDAAPVRFSKRTDAWDFEIVMRPSDQCTRNGCVLASAFFPGGGRERLTIYPQMFTQTRDEQVETLVHEIGHIFGLRHFFADVKETAWPSQVFGAHNPFSIMNYGRQSVLTADDKADLKRLYRAAWTGELTNINRTPIKFMKPYHASGTRPDDLVTVGEIPAVYQPRRRAAYFDGV